tara:strand:- start:4815 stop:5339 length:525 start_codon:yes stop_codon:yes gene_type:complete
MPLIPLMPYFHLLNTNYFDSELVRNDTPLVSVKWSDRRLRKTAGFYKRYANGKAEIVVSRPVLEFLPEQALLGTLCHEMIHAWVDLVLEVRESHGSNFLARMDLINSAQSNFNISIFHNFPVKSQAIRWIVHCPKCGVTGHYKRFVRGAACRKCCEKYNGGRWDSNCLLVYEAA